MGRLNFDRQPGTAFSAIGECRQGKARESKADANGAKVIWRRTPPHRNPRGVYAKRAVEVRVCRKLSIRSLSGEEIGTT